MYVALLYSMLSHFKIRPGDSANTGRDNNDNAELSAQWEVG